ncbi:MAG: hypothetical protein KatS3mg031_2269 [Chitinophagales bacterium]|nr:MAG: hypothetical protein KatS3mg031_2269 [Chitinophagales bacterium]
MSAPTVAIHCSSRGACARPQLLLKKIAQIGGIVLIFTLSACTTDLPPNPYERVSDPVDTSSTPVLDPNSFAGIHKNILKPTCANSGCHDGTFEPDYRTIESAYNTLVYHPIIKNDTLGTFRYRVVPGNKDMSILYIRMTQDLNGNSGIMPLSVDSGSNWYIRKNEYIQNIVNWIEAGAPDLLGNKPTLPNKQPQMLGVVATPLGSTTPFQRFPNGAIKIPNGFTAIDIWVSISDDSTAVTSLLHNKIKFSLKMNDFTQAAEESLQIVTSPLTAPGYDGTPVPFFHKIQINPYAYGNPGNNIFMRVYVKDPQNAITEIPSKYSEEVFKTYFTLVLLD